MGKLSAFSFKAWIDEHRHLLKPPVGNKVVFEDTEFIIMVVGGPNVRKDYHIDPAEEFFYQLEGDMVLKVVEDGEFRDVTIKEGEILLLPPWIPHSPQRFENTVGLVVERKRHDDELDGLRWYCDSCHETLYEETFHLEDITKDLPPVFDRFFGSEAHRTCKACGEVMPIPEKFKRS
ncbi:MAG: 3-hydroxyanthranilate 3,4-dioxygenase [Myxococcales bacterium]|nr:3-hydroxyanthranilate 3,4-dioxygenase [Myxococcales bacterium]